MIHGEKRIYRFGGVQIDPAQRRIERDGQKQHLREKAFEVLIYLLENRGRIVKKEELIENVWKAQAVTDDSLVQSIVEIRKALGDSRRNPQFIQTIPKAGYRLNEQVEEIQEHQIADIEEISSFTMEIEEEDLAPEPPKAIPPPGSRRASLILGIFLILALSISLYIARMDSLLPEKNGPMIVQKVPGKKLILVMFFDNQSGDKELDWLREGLPDMLVTGLSHSNAVTLLSRQQLHDILKRIGHKDSDRIRMEEALEVAAKTKADAFILGGFAKIGNGMRIDVQLYDGQNSQLLRGEQLVLSKPEEILTKVDLLSMRIASRLGITRQTDLADDKEMTRSVDAYRYYSLAVEKARRLHNTEAINLLQKAIAIDPQFAMAHARIGYAYAVTWHLPERAKPHLQQAFELSERLSAKDRLYINAWYAIANEDDESAIEAFRKLIKQYPYEIEPYPHLAKLLHSKERYQEALECLKQGLTIDPESKEVYNLLGGIYSSLGRHKEGIAAKQKTVELAPQDPNTHDSLGLSYQLAGHYVEAIQEYNRALELNPDFEIAVVHLANTYFQLGRYREALLGYRRYIDLAPSDAEKSRGYTCIARIHWKKQEWKLAEENFKRAAQDSALRLDLLFLEMDRGNKPIVHDVQQHVPERTAGRGGKTPERFFYYKVGMLLLRTGKTEEAIAAFERALQSATPGWDMDPYEDCLANAYLELGRYDSAVREYKRVLQFNPNYPLSHFYLAQAYEGQKDFASARSHYQMFLQQWKDADPELPEMKIARNKIST
jgi:tetratricopeptide (TPR) repeat protein